MKIQKKSWFCCIRQPWNSIPNNFDLHTLFLLYWIADKSLFTEPEKNYHPFFKS
jgi:hypothetical protein